MRKTLFPLLGMFLILFSSCNFSEDLYINEDGSGKISLNFDGSALMKMGGGNLNETIDEEVLDSVISFRQLLAEKKDSIANLSPEEQERLKKLERFTMRMVVNQKTEEMKIDMYTDFKKVSELTDVFGALQNAGALNAKGEDAPENPLALGSDASEVEYSLQGNTFRRIGKVTNKELLQQAVDSLGPMESFFGTSTYTLNYHFPRPVKSVSQKGALLSQDRKTVTWKVPFLDYMKDPELLNIAVILED
ncbi:hypothetical protein GWK08_16025 [Leptobacterium flavescens]|uniref:Lipoprotein n=1 Tax=Leptobacterium flavescens TaxID=472055 RepID=A0A6P0UP69_9FLAO|nr:hypothetical protein [Leptobacterium flavescens]NER14965.1 hypothetical protein [Leptobacterium flavescens]